MTHIDSVDQKKLVQYYSKARVFVLPSRQDGLAMVQSQALVCGLPIVCSEHSGGRDLAKYLKDKRWIIEMKNSTIEELERCIDSALTLAITQSGERTYSEGVVDQLTWSTYGKRYSDSMGNMIHKKGHH